MEGLARYPGIEIVRCADIDPDRALRGHLDFGIPYYGTTEELLADDKVNIAVNLTWPNVHAEVTAAALKAGKHVYSEKTMALSKSDADVLIDLATTCGVSLGSAPDTFLGTWGATSRAIVDSGVLGDIIAATAFVKHNWVESRHPDPTFLFKPGAGPTLDRGPYYVTALVNLLGPVSQVIAMTANGPATRKITAPNRLVDTVPVEVATHQTALLRFDSGAIATVVFSNDVWGTELPDFEVYGTRATMSLPNLNFFDGAVKVADNRQPWRQASRFSPNIIDWVTVEQVGEPHGQRGMGIADMIASWSGTAQRTNPQLARHVLDVLLAIEESDSEGAPITLKTTCDRPVWGDLPTVNPFGT
jgi:predicted dehydrogenase